MVGQGVEVFAVVGDWDGCFGGGCFGGGVVGGGEGGEEVAQFGGEGGGVGGGG